MPLATARRIKTATILAAMHMLALSSTPVPAADNPLLAEQWQQRPLVVVASSASDPLLLKLRQQLQQAQIQSAWQQRDLVLYTLIDGRASRNDTPLSAAASLALSAALPAEAAQAPRLVLIGKDGQPKLVTQQLDDIATIFKLIDSMPMRRQEMQTR